MSVANIVIARRIGGRTVLSEARAASPLRLVSPSFPATTSASVCLVTFGGGLLDGDAIDLSLSVEEGATLVAFTQASTKVFRGAARQTLTADVRGTLVFVPHAVSCFAGARWPHAADRRAALRRRLVRRARRVPPPVARLYGDRWAMESLDLRTRISRDGRTLVRDALVLDGDIAARVAPYDAVGTLCAVGPRVGSVARGSWRPPSSRPRWSPRRALSPGATARSAG